MFKEQCEQYVTDELIKNEHKIIQAKKEDNNQDLQFYLGKSVALLEFTYKFKDIKVEGAYVL